MNMYIGETERNIRQLFATAKRNERCLIFFDELDSIAPRRDNGAGVMHRVVSQLLAELDAVNLQNGGGNQQSSSMVFVVGATNRPDLISPELLMPGRFERLVYLDVANTREEQLKLLKAVCRQLPIDHVQQESDGENNGRDLLYEQLVDHIPIGRWTGADFYAMTSDALTHSVGRLVARVDKEIRELNEQLLADCDQLSLPQESGLMGYEEPVRHIARQYLSSSGRKEITAEIYLDHIIPQLEQGDRFKLSVTKEDFMLAIDRLEPSVGLAELYHYRQKYA